MSLLLFPFLIQLVAITSDEWMFHRQRGLPRWERIGHPLDTLSILLCFGYLLLFPPTPTFLKWYMGLATVSALLVTKDEWVHKELCPAAEQWLHAILFLNHPLLLTAAGLIWWQQEHSMPLLTEILGPLPNWCGPFLQMQLIGCLLFFLYQAIYWNFVWRESTTSSTTS